jgi:hypothetical protein
MDLEAVILTHLCQKESQMKKRAKKLTLSRETLRHLGRMHLAQVAGGGQTFEIETGCACTDGCGGGGTGTCGCGGTGTCGCGGSGGACTTGQTFEILSGCATNC